MRQCMDAENLHRRLKKIIGQVQAIDRMVDEDVPCEDVLLQINAAKSALHKVGQVVLEGHINHCVRDGIEHGDAEQTIASFTKAVERFANNEVIPAPPGWSEAPSGRSFYVQKKLPSPLDNLYPYRYNHSEKKPKQV